MPAYLIVQPGPADSVTCEVLYGVPQLLMDVGTTRISVQLPPGPGGGPVLSAFLRELSLKAQQAATKNDELLATPRFQDVQQILAGEAGRHAVRGESDQG